MAIFNSSFWEIDASLLVLGDKWEIGTPVKGFK